MPYDQSVIYKLTCPSCGAVWFGSTTRARDVHTKLLTEHALTARSGRSTSKQASAHEHFTSCCGWKGVQIEIVLDALDVTTKAELNQVLLDVISNHVNDESPQPRCLNNPSLVIAPKTSRKKDLTGETIEAAALWWRLKEIVRQLLVAFTTF